jgi:hypothetical protein
MKIMKIKFPLELLEKCILIAICVITLLLAPKLGNPQERHLKSWSSYYPLSKDNTWRYIVAKKTAEKPRQFVSWRVLNLSRNSEGPVFAVWPTPAESDDDGMQLQFTDEGLKELGNDFYVLRFPLVRGSKWSVDRQERVFTVLSEGEPCAVGKYKFSECAVIQDDDREAKLRTLTTYAFGVGPVRYEYRRLDGGEAETQATQTMEIVSYSVKPSPPSRTAQARGTP